MAQNLCNHSKAEICNALQIIKDICESNNCSTCPFGYGINSCKLQDYAPCDLNVSDQEEVWRAIG